MLLVVVGGTIDRKVEEINQEKRSHLRVRIKGNRYQVPVMLYAGVLLHIQLYYFPPELLDLSRGHGPLRLGDELARV